MPQIPVACFAPVLTDELLAKYKALVGSAEPEVEDALQSCLACVEVWYALPESKRPGRQWEFDGGKTIATETPLEEAHVKKLWDVTPWMRELLAMEPLFDALPFGELRNAAFHLLWHCKELTMDREPMTLSTLAKKP